MEAAKWDAVLAEAGQAFARFGFKKTSMDQVARAAGVAKGTLYLGCTSKRDLFYQAILRELRSWNAALAGQIDPREPAEELLLRTAQEALATRDQYPLALGLVMGEYDADLPDWQERLDELRAHGLSTILEILRIGARQGRFRGDLDLEVVAGIFLDLITATMFNARGPRAEEQVAQRAIVSFDLFMNGLSTEQPAAAEVSRA